MADKSDLPDAAVVRQDDVISCHPASATLAGRNSLRGRRRDARPVKAGIVNY